MKKSTMLFLLLLSAMTLSAQNTVDKVVEKLLESHSKTPMRETMDKDPETGKIVRHIKEYVFPDINSKTLEPIVSTLQNPDNGYYTNQCKLANQGYLYELRVADSDPNYRTIYILQTKDDKAELHVLYGKKTYEELPTNFCYSTKKYHAILNKSTGAKLGISFDYNNHASTYKESAPSGIGPNSIKISEGKVFRFRFVPTVVVDTRISDIVSEDCYIVSEDMLALEDGSETSEGQWLMFRYLDKKNPFQQWKLIEENGTITIINKATGRCVDLAGGDSKEGAAVFSYDINTDTRSNANQKWMIEEVE